MRLLDGSLLYWSGSLDYKLKKWHNKTKVIKKRDNFMCQECRRYGKSTDAECVHHIYPTDDYPELFYKNDNLVSLCNACHNRMHDRITQEITTAGRRWQSKVRYKLFGGIDD